MLQLPSGAMLASLALWLAEPLDSSTPAAAAAAAGPRQLNQAAQAAITAALSRVVTKPKVRVHTLSAATATAQLIFSHEQQFAKSHH